MSQSQALQKYFDILLSQKLGTDSKHPLADEKKRHKLYQEIRKYFSKIDRNLVAIHQHIKDSKSDYSNILANVKSNISNMAGLSDEEYDFYIRTLAVERLVYTASNASGNVADMLNYLLEGLMTLLFEEGEEILQVLKQTLKTIKKNQPKSLFNRKKTAALKELITETLEQFEQIEDDLKASKQGLMAQDKKMLLTLQQLRATMGKEIIEMAMQNSVLSPSGPKRQQSNAIKKIAQQKSEAESLASSLQATLAKGRKNQTSQPPPAKKDPSRERY